MAHDYTAVFSSDWSECLSPSGPFDFIAWNFPQLRASLEEVFRAYTGNRISLGAACDRVRQALPGPVTAEMMDAYLDREFAVYRGVPELIEWCREAGDPLHAQHDRHDRLFPAGVREGAAAAGARDLRQPARALPGEGRPTRRPSWS